MRSTYLFLLVQFLCVLAVAQKLEIPQRKDNVVSLKAGDGGVTRGLRLTDETRRTWKSAADALGVERSDSNCSSMKTMLLDFVSSSSNAMSVKKVPIWHSPYGAVLFFIAGMTIDADGAPNAYNSENTGLDELANAGEPNDWNGIITGLDGNPLLQQRSDPFPGYYISCTSLSDKTKTFDDPTRYVDASKIPYVALPHNVAELGQVQLGDFAAVMNLHNGKLSFAIYADIGKLGEGSVALADALGISSDARQGGEADGILYLLFAGSGNSQPRTVNEIQSEGEKLLGNWKRVASCFLPHSALSTATVLPEENRDLTSALRQASGCDNCKAVASRETSSEICKE